VYVFKMYSVNFNCFRHWKCWWHFVSEWQLVLSRDCKLNIQQTIIQILSVNSVGITLNMKFKWGYGTNSRIFCFDIDKNLCSEILPSDKYAPIVLPSLAGHIHIPKPITRWVRFFYNSINCDWNSKSIRCMIWNANWREYETWNLELPVLIVRLTCYQPPGIMGIKR